ncbi:MAG: right-handed parallel beta-helix repeat-containing protein [Armatimonadetes bacterium]|nr:right-handed parallel beta-helix repeat-containing protein [Armatimonadota bacterium]
MHRLALTPLLLTVALSCACAQVNQQAIDDVAAGKLKEAKASWWGFDPVDATACLQAAIDSKVPKLTVDNVGKPWIVTPIKLVANQEITFEQGVEVLAKADEFKGGNDSLFSASLAENISLIGYGATLRMRRADYDDATRYKHAEWRMVLKLLSCTNIRIYGLTLAESGGDGIYLGTAQRGVTNKNIHIKDVICDKNYRQGISVITAEDLLIENTILRDTAGTAPQAGIDFEPNNPDEKVVNCVMRNCLAENNNSWGYVAYLPPLRATSAPVGLRLENCKAVGNKGGAFAFITNGTEAGAVPGQVELVNCEFTGNGGAAFSIGSNPPPPMGCRITVQGGLFADNAVDKPLQSPIMFATRQGADRDVGGVAFTDVVVRDPVARNPMIFVDMTSGLNVSGVTGNLLLEKDGQRQNVALTKELLAQWMPVVVLKKIPRLTLAGKSFAPLQAPAAGQKIALPPWRLRKQGAACVWAKQGEAVTVTVNSGQIGKYATAPISVVVKSPSGQEVTKAQAPFGQESPISFTAPETGLYTLLSDAGGNYAVYTSSTHPLNLCSLGEAIHIIGSTGTLYLYVPAGTSSFGLRVHGEGMGEGIKATLMNAAGEVVESKDNIARTDMLSVELPQPSPGETWSLKLERPSAMAMEDYYLDPVGIPPLLAPAKECLLKPAP